MKDLVPLLSSVRTILRAILLSIDARYSSISVLLFVRLYKEVFLPSSIQQKTVVPAKHYELSACETLPQETVVPVKQCLVKHFFVRCACMLLWRVHSSSKTTHTNDVATLFSPSKFMSVSNVTCVYHTIHLCITYAHWRWARSLLSVELWPPWNGAFLYPQQFAALKVWFHKPSTSFLEFKSF